MLTSLRIHGPVFLLLLAVVLLAFGRLTTTPLWDGLDAQIICDAHSLSLDPSPMFSHVGFYFSQPLLQLAFLGQYRLFGLDTAGYLWVNLVVHALNSFVVYMLVNMLFPRRKMALTAGLLFALAVGSYGRVFMTIHQLESLVLAGLQMLVLYFFIRNDFRREGSIRSPLFLVGLGLFLLTGLTKAASFSLVGCLMAYKAFFLRQRASRAIVSPDVLVFLAVGISFYFAQHHWGYGSPAIFRNDFGETHFTLMSVKNLFRYLNLMFFPMQQSPILETSPGWVVLVYHARVVIRVALTLSILSYSFFGFVFGSRAIRFFIAWTFITLAPFTSQNEAGEWLNLSHLYLTSVGFCVILAAGVDGTSNLLGRRRWRRLVPYLVPVYFAVISVSLAWTLDRRNKNVARQEPALTLRAEAADSCRPENSGIRDNAR